MALIRERKATEKWVVKAYTVLLLVLGLAFPLWTRAAENTEEKPSAKSDEPSASSADDEEANLLYIKGRQKVLDGKFEEAAPILEQALKGNPDSAFVNHQLAEVYLRLSDFEKAEVAGKKAVAKDPKNIEYRATLGGIYASVKKYPEAKDEYRKIVELEPGNQKAPLLLGILEAESGDMDAGIKTLTKATEETPDNYMAYFYRAKIYLEKEDIKRAKADLDKCLQMKPAFVEAGTALGLLHERLGESEDAIKAYSRIQGNGRFNKRLAQLYLNKNEFDKALAQLLEYEQVEPDDYTARVKIALIYFEMKQFQKAKERFVSILKEQPDADNVRFYLGAVLEELKEADKAMVEFKKVTKESTFYREAMLHVGFILKEKGKFKEGVEFAKKLSSQAPEVVEFYDMHASFFESQRDYKKALAVIATGIKRFPQDEKLLYFEGALLDKMGDREKSIANMKKILTVNPNNAHALNFLGYTYAEMGTNLDEAEGLIEKALALRPEDGYIEDSMGWVLFKKGKIEQALVRLEKAAKTLPEEAIVYEHLGDVYKERKEHAKAEEMYKKAVVLSEKKDKDMAKKIQSKIAKLAKDRLPSQEEGK